jgi:exodeoxyribonuclease V gamma subunit
MVPMRLLPFRAICLLGMNDGDFPRRDPAAGLNRLTAELGTDKRRHGDRSTRDDDRYLFLQLFSAAQDVFYLSWLGADPRDGSTREPSALVSELLAAAGAYHAKPEEAVERLVLRHPLQPFSPQAFGAGDLRFFSYRRQWNPAAGSLAGARRAAPPWIGADETLLPLEAESELSLDALRRFLLDPAGQFLRQRLDIRLPQIEDASEDIEPLQAPQRGLQRHALQRAAFDALLEGRDEATMRSSLRARGVLPAGAMGTRALQAILREVGPYAEAFKEWRRDAEATSLPVEAGIGGVRLHGRLADAWSQGKGFARLRFGAPNGSSSIRNGLDWLLAAAAGIETPFVEFHDDGDSGIGPHVRAPVSREAAIEALRQLLALRQEGLQRPLPFAPHSAWALFDADAPERGLQGAARKWRGSERGWAEGDGDAIRLALRGRDPFADAASAAEFARIAGIVFGAVTRGIAAPIELGRIALPEDDAEHADAGRAA